MNIIRRIALMICVLAANAAFAQSPAVPTPREPRDVLSLDATVSAQVQPDTAVVVLAVDKQGAEAAPLTAEVNQILARALTEAKAAAGVQAATGNYFTQPRYDNKGQRNGWQVRAELILKAKEFGVLGTLAGKLAKDMTIASNGFEISPALRDREEAQLIERGIAAFRAKASAASKAFGATGYSIREVAVGQIGGGAPQLAQLSRARGGAMMAADAAAPMAMEPGARELSLTVSGAIQMTR
jgi:predicted secreted protein